MSKSKIRKPLSTTEVLRRQHEAYMARLRKVKPLSETDINFGVWVNPDTAKYWVSITPLKKALPPEWVFIGLVKRKKTELKTNSALQSLLKEVKQTGYSPLKGSPVEESEDEE